mmetsp:Transcript_37906/g.88209  ORF Transcript_37906/g.88209 Transcript_37906/m.88209 type:complete len:228 (-) Transcript_37906:49-732(-)
MEREEKRGEATEGTVVFYMLTPAPLAVLSFVASFCCSYLESQRSNLSRTVLLQQYCAGHHIQPPTTRIDPTKQTTFPTFFLTTFFLRHFRRYDHRSRLPRVLRSSPYGGPETLHRRRPRQSSQQDHRDAGAPAPGRHHDGRRRAHLAQAGTGPGGRRGRSGAVRHLARPAGIGVLQHGQRRRQEGLGGLGGGSREEAERGAKGGEQFRQRRAVPHLHCYEIYFLAVF